MVPDTSANFLHVDALLYPPTFDFRTAKMSEKDQRVSINMFY